MVTVSSGGCWTIATSGSGSQVFAGTITSAAPQEIKGTSGLSISLGAPGDATVQVNGVSVVFPSVYTAPLVLTFVAPPPPTTTTTAPAPTTTTVPPSSTSTLAP
jgi:hypothetical protein